MGVVDALSFIYDIRNDGYESVSVGDEVVVIGMGMTAIDAATQAKRLGAASVTMVYRRTQEEMPCTEHELNIAKLDGCKIIWLAAPVEVIGENGHIKEVVFDEMGLIGPDASGRRSPVKNGATFSLKADMLIKAAGQMPFEALNDSMSLEHNYGKIIVENGCKTSIAGVFAGGDNVNGGREVVDAVQAGKEAAAAMLREMLDVEG